MLSSQDWSDVFNESLNFNTRFDLFYDNYLKCFNTSFLFKTFFSTRKSKSWVTEESIRCLRALHGLRREAGGHDQYYKAQKINITS